MSPGKKPHGPRWGRGPTCGRKRRDVAGQETARPAVGQGPHLREEATRCRRARNRTARGGAGAPPAGGSDEMSPGKKPHGPRWGRGPTCGRKRRDVAGQETARPAVGQGPHLREEATRCRRARNRTARGGAGAPPAGGSDEMSPGKKPHGPRWGRGPTCGRKRRDVAGQETQCREKDLNLRRQTPADLQSAPFGRSGIPANVPTLGDEIGDYSKARKSVSHGVADEPGKGTQPAGLRSEGPPTGCPLPSSRDDRYGLSSAGAC